MCIREILKSIFLFQINLGIYLKDKQSEFSVLVDRSVGGSSIQDGHVELMVHRFVMHQSSLCIILYATNEITYYIFFNLFL